MHWRTVKGPTSVSTVSMTLAMHALPVSLTQAKTCFAGVIDTGEVGDNCWPVSMTLVMHDVTSVNDTGDMLRRCHWHRHIHALPVSMTPVRNFLPVSLTPVKLSKTVKVSLTGVVDTGKKLFTGANDTEMHALPVSLNRRSTVIIEYLREYSKKIKIVIRLIYWGQEKLFEEKNQR
jgi:hypothetical protein